MDTDKVDAAQKRMENGKIQENNKDAGLERSGEKGISKDGGGIRD